MSRLPRVLEVEHLGGYRLRLTFSDGLVRELDFAGVIQDRGGVFEPLGEPAFFAQVAVDSIAGTIACGERCLRSCDQSVTTEAVGSRQYRG